MDTMVWWLDVCVSSDVGLASIRKVLQNCLVFKSIYLVDFPITAASELFRKRKDFTLPLLIPVGKTLLFFDTLKIPLRPSRVLGVSQYFFGSVTVVSLSQQDPQQGQVEFI